MTIIDKRCCKKQKKIILNKKLLSDINKTKKRVLEILVTRRKRQD